MKNVENGAKYQQTVKKGEKSILVFISNSEKEMTFFWKTVKTGKNRRKSVRTGGKPETVKTFGNCIDCIYCHIIFVFS